MKKVFGLLALAAGISLAIVSCKKDEEDCFDCSGTKVCESDYEKAKKDEPEMDMTWDEYKAFTTAFCSLASEE